ncbi:unnamed protein product [Microthlaspi erraticum]|uniref:F-box domain-containing protein n=1 Tax=Microthlaspi erraticum TaxID=1685480 RepID=A0A6D2HNM6_9BRAS|nr:unnamed protein product [Microthlaspi erraticum]
MSRFPENQKKLKLESTREDNESDKKEDPPIPFEVLEAEILTRLPAKSVMRSRCVSKMWSSIIRSQRFTDSYYAMSSATRSRFIVTFSNQVINLRRDPRHLFIFSGEESSSSSAAANLDMTIPSLNLNYLAKCPSVHGLVACCNLTKFTICNPGTRQVLTIPCNGFITSLGYDPVDDQFKALTMVTTPSNDRGFIVHEVVRLGGQGGGSRVKVTSPSYRPLTDALCFNGFVYCPAWAPRQSMNTVIVCFDVRNETISFITTPPDVLLWQSHTSLIEYKGKLASVVPHQDPLSGIRGFDLWMLDDVDKPEWSMQSFVLPYVLVHVTSPGTNKAGEIIFAPRKLSHGPEPFFYLFYYNVETKHLRKVRIHGVADDQAFRSRYGIVTDCYVSVSPLHVESIASLKQYSSGLDFCQRYDYLK